VSAAEVRPASIEDLLAIRGEQGAFWGDRDLAALHHPLLVHEFGETALVIGEPGGPVTAYLFGLLTPGRVGYIHLVGVREGARREGLGRRLYEEFQRRALEGGAWSLKAFTQPWNATSIAFHTALGFAAEEVAGYVGQGETRTIFSKRLREPVSPPFRRRLAGGATLRVLELGDVEELHAAVAANRGHLARWLPWAADQPPQRTHAFVERSVRGAQAGEDLQGVLLADGTIIGIAGFVGLSREEGTVGIGYWLVEAAQGRGTMTEAVAALIEEAFERWKLNRVEIRIAAANARSRALAERLGFREEGVLREAHNVGGRRLDVVVYALLASDRDRRRESSQGRR
jgi:ribosomal-protein-serine acetyltransferase